MPSLDLTGCEVSGRCEANRTKDGEKVLRNNYGERRERH